MQGQEGSTTDFRPSRIPEGARNPVEPMLEKPSIGREEGPHSAFLIISPTERTHHPSSRVSPVKILPQQRGTVDRVVQASNKLESAESQNNNLQKERS